MVVPPSAAARAAWEQIPLAAPRTTHVAGPDWTLDGIQADANATAIAWRLDAAAWQRRDVGPSWRIVVPQGAASTLEVRSEGAGRLSPPVSFTLDGPAPAAGPTPGPAAAAPAILPLLVALVLAAWRSRP